MRTGSSPWARRTPVEPGRSMVSGAVASTAPVSTRDADPSGGRRAAANVHPGDCAGARELRADERTQRAAAMTDPIMAPPALSASPGCRASTANGWSSAA